jgi:hypothetical protein
MSVATKPSMAKVRLWFRQYSSIRSSREELEKREAELKTLLSGAVEELGERDPTMGHERLAFPAPINGVKGISRICRVTPKLNVDKAVALLKEKGLYERCTVTVVEIDEDAIHRELYEDNLSQEEFDSIFTQAVNYAFVLDKE